jgi:iron complex outermembrane receptor protein
VNGKPVWADTNGDKTINEHDLYEDLNGDGKVNQDDRRPYKNPVPDFQFGHTSFLRYRNFDASLTLMAYLGNYVYNNMASNLGNYRELSANLVPVNLHTSVLEYGFEDPQYFSDVYVEDASFLRMDNVSVGYTFGQGRLEGMRVFGAVQNVFTLTGYSGIDPLVGFTGIDNNFYPRSRTFTAGLSYAF